VDRVRASKIPVVSGNIHFAFGAVSISLGRDGEDSVRFVQVVLAVFVAGGLGTMLLLVWTAGFLPSFLDPSAVSVLLAKPAPRWSLLFGKYLGVLVFVALQAVLFFVGTWLALGLRTGIWNVLYLLAIPLVVLNFAVFYSFSLFLAVMTRSTVTCVFGSILFWILCYGMNLGWYSAMTQKELEMEKLGTPFRVLLDGGYWLMPKPADLSTILQDSLQSSPYLGDSSMIEQGRKQGLYRPELAVLSSLLFPMILFGLAIHEFRNTDY
jgi:ABC-type transport system involved in multi-copper enzyme maturation permease subunit